MNYEEIKQIWDEEGLESSFEVNEPALLQRVREKKNGAKTTAEFSELLLFIVNLVAGVFILLTNSTRNVFLDLMVGLMLLVATIVLFGRIFRIGRQRRFGESMLDELEHAIAIAAYQVWLSRIMRWFGLPIGILMGLAIWRQQAGWILLVPVALFLGVAWLASRWEHRIYLSKKRDLESLRDSLLADSHSPHPQKQEP